MSASNGWRMPARTSDQSPSASSHTPESRFRDGGPPRRDTGAAREIRICAGFSETRDDVDQPVFVLHRRTDRIRKRRLPPGVQTVDVGSGDREQLHNVAKTRFRRDMQRALPFVVADVDVRTGTDECLHALDAAAPVAAALKDDWRPAAFAVVRIFRRAFDCKDFEQTRVRDARAGHFAAVHAGAQSRDRGRQSSASRSPREMLSSQTD